ncbi:hypothetical protein F4678DRAFT_451075 [Xylaria arbuscula]|nr:hypothetical protein F4678DRAFT_451075 [Xylaria arbuscula]
MSQFCECDNGGPSGQTTGCLDIKSISGSQEDSQSSATHHGHCDWVPVSSSTSEADLCSSPLTEDNKPGLSSPASPQSVVYNADSNHGSMQLEVSGKHLQETRSQERLSSCIQRQDSCIQTQDSCIQTQERTITYLTRMFDQQREISDTLGAKLYDLFMVMTQSQQCELDKLQKRLLGLQTDAEDLLLGQEWRDLQQKLHDINRKLDSYIKTSTPEAISTGNITDELTLFLSSLLGDIPKVWKGMEALERDIEEERFRDAVSKLGSSEPSIECPTSERENQENTKSISTLARPSVTDILDRYYEFSRLQRERMATRKEKLQALFDNISTELGRLQADLTYEEGRTANMKIRMMFWGDDLEASKVKCPATLIENLETKQSALNRGSEELEEIAMLVQDLPSSFHMIDIRGLGEDQASTSMSTHPESSAMGVKQGSGTTRDRSGVAGQKEDMAYIAELEAKLAEKQANETAWATHFEDLQKREKEAKAALQKRLDAAEFGNTEMRKVVKIVAGKLFEHRERLWGLSTPARKLGEELIKTLEQLDIPCDEPLIYE